MARFGPQRHRKQTNTRQAGILTQFLPLPRGWQVKHLFRMPSDVKYETLSGGGQRSA